MTGASAIGCGVERRFPDDFKNLWSILFNQLQKPGFI
jgi:hypothetical protein